IIGLAWVVFYERFIAQLRDRDPAAWQALGSPLPRLHRNPAFRERVMTGEDTKPRLRSWQYILAGGYRSLSDPDLVRQGDRLRLLLMAELIVLASLFASFILRPR